MSTSRSDGPATLGEWLEYGEKLLDRAGVAFGQVAGNPHDEALTLLLHAAKLPLDSAPTVLAKRLRPAEKTAARELLRRRAEERVPTAYLTGEAWLGGYRFHVDPRVLIPRSYFVEIIPTLGIAVGGKLESLADVCTGSGCLAILLAHHFPRAKVDAIDLDPGALAVARINVRAHRLGRRIKLWRSDVFASVPSAHYDLILSNPPYEPSALVDALPEEFRREPRQALDGGADGLGIIRRLLRQAAGRLTPAGVLLIEVGGLRQAMDREFAAQRPEWLPTDDGADCVCLFRAPALRAAQRVRS
jgi:ribosomal protein L3 glutamine methyltransferase